MRLRWSCRSPRCRVGHQGERQVHPGSRFSRKETSGGQATTGQGAAGGGRVAPPVGGHDLDGREADDGEGPDLIPSIASSPTAACKARACRSDHQDPAAAPRGRSRRSGYSLASLIVTSAVARGVPSHPNRARLRTRRRDRPHDRRHLHRGSRAAPRPEPAPLEICTVTEKRCAPSARPVRSSVTVTAWLPGARCCRRPLDRNGGHRDRPGERRAALVAQGQRGARPGGAEGERPRTVRGRAGGAGAGGGVGGPVGGGAPWSGGRGVVGAVVVGTVVTIVVTAVGAVGVGAGRAAAVVAGTGAATTVGPSPPRWAGGRSCRRPGPRRPRPRRDGGRPPRARTAGRAPSTGGSPRVERQRRRLADRLGRHPIPQADRQREGRRHRQQRRERRPGLRPLADLAVVDVARHALADQHGEGAVPALEDRGQLGAVPPSRPGHHQRPRARLTRSRIRKTRV